MTKNELITQLKISLQHLNVSKVLLFGSYAKGTQTIDSDVDLLVKLPQLSIQLENIQILI